MANQYVKSKFRAATKPLASALPATTKASGWPFLSFVPCAVCPYAIPQYRRHRRTHLSRRQDLEERSRCRLLQHQVALSQYPLPRRRLRLDSRNVYQPRRLSQRLLHRSSPVYLRSATLPLPFTQLSHLPNGHALPRSYILATRKTSSTPLKIPGESTVILTMPPPFVAKIRERVVRYHGTLLLRLHNGISTSARQRLLDIPVTQSHVLLPHNLHHDLLLSY